MSTFATPTPDRESPRLDSVERAAAWLSAEVVTVVFYASLPVAAVLLVVGQVLAAVVACTAWVLTALGIWVSERYWSRRRASRALVPAPLWITLPLLGSVIGTVRLSALLVVRVALILGLPLATVIAISRKGLTAIAGAAVAWFLVLLWLSVAAVRNRVIVGDFEDVARRDEAHPANVDVADLLRGELARLTDLLHVVGDRRAVPSGLSEQTALDATLSVDELSEAFRGASGDAMLSLGKLSIPLAPFVHVLGKMVASPRITGRLHRDGDTLILTAQTSGARRIAWRVEASLDGRRPARRRPAIVRDQGDGQPLHALAEEHADGTDQGDEGSYEVRNGDAPAGAPVLAEMVRELSLRIYTDLALDQSVRWEACEHFVAGLRSFRSCLRTPKNRKVNLRRAEGHFLEALAEDEDFPLAYYNLGVVYTELSALATAAGRIREAETRLSAAQTSFGRAIEKAPSRWDCHFAFTQTQLSYGRHAVVGRLGQFMLRRTHLTLEQEAKTRELIARAAVPATSTRRPYPRASGQRQQGAVDPRVQTAEASREARRATELALRVLLVARARRATIRSRHDDRAKRAAQLASACLLTYGKSYLMFKLARQGGRFGRTRDLYRQWRMNRLIGVISRLGDSRAELQHAYGMFALEIDELRTAESQLREAAASAPTRPRYTADLARCRARILARRRRPPTGTPISHSERDAVLSPALRALQMMVSSFVPSEDLDACMAIVETYDTLATLGSDARRDRAIAAGLEKAQQRIRQALDRPGDTSPTSGVFLLSFDPKQAGDVARLVGEYGKAAHEAYDYLLSGQRIKDGDALHDGSGRDSRHRKSVKEFEKALEAAERAVSLNPLSTFAWETLGDIFAELSDYENAHTAWKEALRTDPDNPHLYAKIGQSHWNIAFERGARQDVGELRRAARYFRAALLLYGNDDRAKRILTHYRLSKLSSALGWLSDARLHLRIVAAASNRPPLVGWLNFGMACLRREEFSEAEHYFGLVIERGRELEHGGTPENKAGLRPDAIVDDRLDERLWPLALVRAWAHVGLVLSWLDRDARQKDAEAELNAAEDLLESLYGKNTPELAAHERFPTRIRASIAEVRGRLSLVNDDSRTAVPQLEAAISQYPYSRAYAILADALERQVDRRPESEARRRAIKLAQFATRFAPADSVPAETHEVRCRLGIEDQDASHAAAAAPHTPHGAPDNGG